MQFYIPSNVSGENANLYFRIMVNGKRYQCNSLIKVNAKEWQTGKFWISTKKEDKVKRMLLRNIENAFEDTKSYTSKDDIKDVIKAIVNADVIEIQQKLKEQEEEARKAQNEEEQRKIAIKKEEQRLQEENVVLAYERFIAEISNQERNYKGKIVSESTKKQHINTLRYLNRFVEECIDGHTLIFSMLNKTFYNGFVSWLYKQGLKHNTIGNRIKCLKAVINAQRLSLRIQAEEFLGKDCPVLKESTKAIALTEEEVDMIAKADLSLHKRLEPYRDQFVLMCWTGVRYSDLDKLNYNNINKEYNMFVLEAQKTGRDSTIKIFPQAQAILDKYDGGRAMPNVISDQKFNEAIKEIMQIVSILYVGSFCDTFEKKHTEMNAKGIVKRVTKKYYRWEVVTAHTARRTFATNMRRRGNDYDVIRSATGHSSEEALRRYIKSTQLEVATKLK